MLIELTDTFKIKKTKKYKQINKRHVKKKEKRKKVQSGIDKY